MWAKFTKVVTSWAFPGKKRLRRFAETPLGLRAKAGYAWLLRDVTLLGSRPVAEDSDPTPDEAGDDAGDPTVAASLEEPPGARGDEPSEEGPTGPTSTTDSADPEDAEESSLEHVRVALYRSLEEGIENVLALFPATGVDSDAVDVLDSVRKSALSNIPQPPTAAQAVLSLCQRPNYSFQELTELIERDPSLSAALLRHANSAWYGTADAGRVVGLRAAVHRVGTKGVHASVMSSIVEGAMSCPGPKFATPAR
ncbi:MAG TPA: HDOD domain-containing protein, partial [Gemmatimonadetes bacterium]|nr:HDOD domain-containing protein [Gemmatimonadota bacterium]